jgi:glycerophosphoryl diester phosphodiesterase
VVISQDYQVVVSHEPWLSAKLGRDASGKLIDPAQEQQHNLYQLSYATIERCSLGEWAHPDFPEQQLELSYRPLLREVLQLVTTTAQELGRSVGFSVEIKSSPEGDDIFHPRPTQFVSLVLAELQALSTTSCITLLSFDPRILQVAREVCPSLALCLLIEDCLPPVPALFSHLGFVPDVLGPDFQLLSTQTVQAIRQAYPQLRLVPWTVNKPEEFALVLSWQTDGITTDYPDRLLALLN